MTTDQLIPIVLGLFSAVIVAAFRRYIKRLGNVWASAFVLAIAFALAGLVLWLTGKRIDALAVFLTANLVHEGLKSLLGKPADTKAPTDDKILR